MAERETVAILIIDETGAVRSINALRDSLPQLERQTRTTADVFSDRMFSMRHAAIALLGSFTLAGIILELKNLATAVIESSAAFGEFKRRGELLTGEFKEFLVEALNVNQVLDEISASMDRINNLVEKAGGGTAGEGAGRLTKFLFGAHPIGQTILALDKALELLNKMAGPAAAHPVQGPPVPSGFFPGAEAPAGIGNAPRYTPALDEAIKKQRELFISTMQLVEGYHNLSDAAQGWSDDLSSIEDLTINQTSTVEHLKFNYQQLADTVALSSEIINAAAASGLISQRNAARAQMIILAVMSVIKGKIELAEALAAAARYDYGAAALHTAAARLYFVAAAFQGIAAITGPAGGAGSVGGTGNFTAAGQLPMTSRGGQTVTVIIEGNVVGNEEFIRDHIVPGIQKAFTDNANGGGFA